MVPVSILYIETPQSRHHEFNIMETSVDQMATDGLHTWQYKGEGIDRLKNL